MAHPQKEEGPALLDRTPNKNRRQSVQVETESTAQALDRPRPHVQQPIPDRYVTTARRWIATIRAERGGQS